MPQLPTYVVVTPARNEARFIDLTIKSMLAQTRRPRKWVIVSDGSTDGTDEIVGKYTAAYDWIELTRMPEHRDRQFAAKVSAFNAGYARLRHLSWDAIAALDADISFDENYFEFLLSKLAENSHLGLVGTPFAQEGATYDYRFANIEHVSGACQLFRRECFDSVGGYTPVKGGGIDWIAVTTARMKGWKTRTFTEQVCHHHRPMGTASQGKLKAHFMLGRQDYYLGGHALWQVFRGCYQMKHKPYFLGGFLLIAGYGWAWLTRVERPVSRELIRFHQQEQVQRLYEKLHMASKIFESIGYPRANDKNHQAISPGNSDSKGS
jgi:glycosyltransferase involved in cell wall biosynthesis